MKNEERSFEDLLNQAEVKDWLYRAERDMFPKMQASVLSMVIATGKPDAKLALEIGAAVLFDKPMVVVVQRGVVLPETLRRIARAIVVIDDFTSAADQEAVAVAIKSAIAKVHKTA
jgi:glycosyltransferase A (GT-A) superfamily protein (DUF2064 family)